jgi:thiopeptide-type bacteriocin biosynthesis protein
METMSSSGQTWKLVIDTYYREVNRYGGCHAMELCERIFQADSEAATAILHWLRPDDLGEMRWRFAALGIDQLLEDGGLTLREKCSLVAEVANAYAKELGWVGATRHVIQAKYRNARAGLETLLGQHPPDDRLVTLANAAFRRRSRCLQPHLRQLQTLEGAMQLSRPLTSILTSLLHMHVNRMLRGSHRQHEALIYLFLQNYYESRLARERHEGTDQSSRTAKAEETSESRVRPNDDGSIAGLRAHG